jgi:hypothetical protein
VHFLSFTDRKGLIKIISTRYFLVIKEIKKLSSRYDFDQYFRSGYSNGAECKIERLSPIK